MSRTNAFLRRSLAFLVALGLGPGAIGQILEVHSDSLTTYQAGKTKVQDAKPLHQQRGVNVDGSMREGSTLPLAIAGNPFENAWHGDAKNNGVRLDTGTWAPMEVDLSLPAPGFRFLIGRTYNARQDSSGQYDSNGPQGYNWFQTSQPEIKLYDDATDTKDVIYLVFGADRYAEYKRTGTSSNEYKATNGAAGVFQYASGSPDTYTLTDQQGLKYTFFGFNTASNKADGQLWTIVDLASNKAYVGDPTTASTAVTNGFDSGGRITKAVDSASRRFTYTYTNDAASVPRLTQVKAEIKTGGSWESSPTGVSEVGRVDYTYYGNESNGDAGDLKTVQVTLPLTDSGINEIRTQYYRYWEGTYNSSTNPGYPHEVKLAVDAEGVRKYDWTADSTFDDDFLTETTDNLKPYSSAYMEYDSSHRISLAWFNGQCGCSGAGTGTHTYRYETNGSYSDSSGYTTTWARRTSVNRPDSSWITQYFDETGQPLSKLITDADPANTGPQPSMWVTFADRDSDGMVSTVGTPASVTAYTHSTGAITQSSSVGLIWAYTRSTSGSGKGYATKLRYKEGTGGSLYYEHSSSYEFITKTIGSSSVIRPLLDDEKNYSVAVTLPLAGHELATDFTNTARSSPNELSVETQESAVDAVDTAENGSNSADSSKEHEALDRTSDFEKDRGGHITYREYSKGLLTKIVLDADTTKTSSGEDFDGITVPSGYSSSGTPLHEKTTSTYDAQGRLDTQTLADGRVTKSYYSVLADRRLVTIEYPKYVSGSGTFYGPVNYSVRNHAGRTEVAATIAVTGGTSTAALSTHIDETDADPITAVDTGSSFGAVAKLRTSVYDEAGTTLEEDRDYFSIPSSGAGTDGTHYDPTNYGYDDLGRRRRVKEAHGTITRTVYDARGNVVERWIGTNDSSFAGGESGTDNMVKVEEDTFDGGAAGGNGLVTKRTLFIQDSSTGKRETLYARDAKGSVLLQTNPMAPHIFSSYDNMGRVIASGSFSSTASITVGADDPTTETSNRLALSQTFYDKRGQIWKSQRHKINQSSGADEDNLQTLSWFDGEGRLVKRDGEQLEKFSYDRLGRQTHSFTLASDNDSAYADMDDVGGDAVLVENQTTYDTDGSVLMEARIDRFHSDKDTGSTTGALDTNADGLAKKYTASDVKGRIQISAMWYDALGRLEDRIEYGTYGGSTFDRNGLSVSSRSDTALRTTHTYNTDGTLQQIEDSKGLKTRFEYDALGRRTKVIANYVDGTPGGGGNGDQDQVVSYAFADGLQTSITADLPSGETDQVTTYTFGTVKGTGAGDSKIATGHLLQKTTYPDSSGSSDVVTFAYNALSQEIYKRDQAGNIYERDYDDGGRETHRRVTTLASGFDGAVRRISTTYTSLGQRQLVTQYDNATVGSGSVVDEVKYTYTGWAGLDKFEQDRNSGVGAFGSVDDYEISYTYSKSTSGRNTVRRSGMVLPDGNVISFGQRSAGGLFDVDAARVTEVKDGTTTYATYKYNGLDQVVNTALDEASVMSKRFTSTTGDYPDLDRFNRVVTSKWTKDLATDVDFFKVNVAWDRNSNVVSQDDTIHSGVDALYTNDDLNRLIDAKEGTLSGGSIASTARDQLWTLNQTGNWNRAKLDLNGDGDYVDADESDDTRTHNAMNELTGRDTDTNGTDNFSLTYDAAGNLTDDGESYEYEWDAFYRLRKVKNTSSHALVAEYTYNGLGYRLGVHQDTDTDGDVDGSDKWYYSAYDERWRAVATFRESDTSPKEQFLYHNAGLGGYGSGSYIDLVILRDRDADTAWTSASDGTLEERIYYCQNWRADVVAIVGVDGDSAQMKEWVKYSAYGVPYGIPGGDADSDFDCDATDVNQIQTWISAPSYDLRGDVDLDGDVDGGDKSVVQSTYSGVTQGRTSLSASTHANHLGFGGYRAFAIDSGLYSVRRRTLVTHLGRWTRRDDMGTFDGPNVYAYCKGRSISATDAWGTKSIPVAADPQCTCIPVRRTARGAPATGVFGLEGILRVASIPKGEDHTEHGAHCWPEKPCHFAFRIRLDVTPSSRSVSDVPGTPFYYQWHGWDTVPGPPPGEPHASWSSSDPGAVDQVDMTRINNIGSSIPAIGITKDVPCRTSSSIEITGMSFDQSMTLSVAIHLSCSD